MAMMDLHGNTMDRTTQAAEGLVRRRFTVAELEAMVAAGIIDEDERIELIGGEVVPMSPKGNHHESAEDRIECVLVQTRPRPLYVSATKQLSV